MDHQHHQYNYNDPGFGGYTEQKPGAYVANTEYSNDYTPEQRSFQSDVPPPKYTPFSIRTWVIALLLLVTVGLVGCLEYAIRRLPNELHFTDRTFDGSSSVQRLVKRQDTTEAPFTAAIILDSSSDGPKFWTPKDPATDTWTWDGESPNTGSISFADPGDFHDQRTTTQPLVPGITDPVQVPPPVTTDPPQQPPSTGFLETTEFFEGRQSAPTVGLTPPDSESAVDILSNQPSAPPDATITPAPLPTQKIEEVVSGTVIGGTTSDGTVIGGTTVGGTTRTRIGVSPTRTSDSNEASETEYDKPISSNFTMADLPVYHPGEFTNTHYIIGTYLGTLVAILFSILWTVVSVELQHLEPFYQISRPGGALMKYTLCHTYLTQFSYAVPFLSFWNQHWAVFCSSLITLLSLTIIPPFAAGTLHVEVPNLCWDPILVRTKDELYRQYCYPTLLVSEIPTRILQASLALVTIVGFFLLLILWRRGSFLYAPVTTVAGVAAIAQSPPFLAELQSKGTFHPELELANMAVQLTHVVGANGQPVYSMIFVQPHQPWYKRYFPGISNVLSQYTPVARHARNASRSRGTMHHGPVVEERQVVLRIWFMCLFWIYLLALFGIVTAYRTIKESVLDKWLNRGTVDVKIVVTLLGALTQAFWAVVGRDIQAVTPYHNLSKRNKRAEHSILLSYVHTIPIYTSFRALFRGDTLVFLTSTATLFAEILTVTIPAVPFSRNQKLKDNIIVGWLCVGLLGTMLLILTSLIFIASRMKFTMQPNTIAGLLAYICWSRMLGDFEGLSMSDESETRKRLISLKKTYGLGHFVGIDGVERLGIDEEGNIHRGLDG